MDFMKLLKSLEQALYEVMVWLVFYPLTMWKVLTAPAAMMAYADDELDDADEDRYSDRLSPPIFLAITLGLAHALEIATGNLDGQDGMLADDRNLLAFRMILFSVYPLALSVRVLQRQKVALDRKTLRPPFYAQCYVAAPWAFVSSSAVILAYSLRGETAEALAIAIGAIVLAGVWYMAIQARWFARTLGTGVVRGLWNALVTFVQATVLAIGLTWLVGQF